MTDIPRLLTLPNIVSVTSLVGVILVGGYFINDTKRNDQDVRHWQEEHLSFHTSRRAEYTQEFTSIQAQISAAQAALQATVTAFDDRIDSLESSTVVLSNRLSANEARRSEDAQVLRDLQSAVASSNVKLEVILSWIDEQRRRNPSSER